MSRALDIVPAHAAIAAIVAIVAAARPDARTLSRIFRQHTRRAYAQAVREFPVGARITVTVHFI